MTGKSSDEPKRRAGESEIDFNNRKAAAERHEKELELSQEMGEYAAELQAAPEPNVNAVPEEDEKAEPKKAEPKQ